MWEWVGIDLALCHDWDIDCILIFQAENTGGQPETSGQQCERRGSKLLRQERIGAENKHAGHFEVHDLTKGKGTFYVSHDSLNLHHMTILEDVCDL